MMLWRIETAKHVDAALDGGGARLFGGRWNRAGTTVVYLSTTLSLAAFERFVHLLPAGKLDRLFAVGIELPDAAIALATRPARLPAGWRSSYPVDQTANWGSAWARARSSLLAAVPSALLPLDLYQSQTEYNLMLNPEHADIALARVTAQHPFTFDGRMWK